MLIYEKDNKLNINFENTVDGEPDLQIGKDGDKTEVLIDGQPGGGSGGGELVVRENDGTLDKTMGEIQTAFLRGDRIELQGNSDGGVTHFIMVFLHEVHYSNKGNAYEGIVGFVKIAGTFVYYLVSEASEAAALSAYPTTES